METSVDPLLVARAVLLELSVRSLEVRIGSLHAVNIFPLEFGRISRSRSIALIRLRLGLFPNNLEFSGNLLASSFFIKDAVSLERPRSSSNRLNDKQHMYGCY
uniref:Uncharacterized protein n=1 Tax=Keteleeria davidiana TaxID=3324 RepID=B7ZIL3_KETDA|nr:hypothetical protein KedaC_p004 [Keteleeria davidiana]BAH11380.1 hypothetical protein [Keteleeria davidiana]